MATSYECHFAQDYTAAVNVETATQLTMTGNSVAGAERVAYKISGQPCDTSEELLWSGTVVSVVT